MFGGCLLCARLWETCRSRSKRLFTSTIPCASWKTRRESCTFTPGEKPLPQQRTPTRAFSCRRRGTRRPLKVYGHRKRHQTTRCVCPFSSTAPFGTAPQLRNPMLCVFTPGSSEEMIVLCRSHSWARTLCTFQRFIVCLGSRTLSLVSNIFCFALPSLLCSQQATVDLPRDSECFDGRTCHTARAWLYESAVISLFACDAFSVGRVFSISSCFGIPER